MGKIVFVDQDGHTVKLTKEEVAACLKDMGNPSGTYNLVTRQAIEEVGILVSPFDCGGIRARTFPNYSRFTLWRKRRKGSRLLPRVVKTTLHGKQIELKQDAVAVWLMLKKNEVHTVYVD